MATIPLTITGIQEAKRQLQEVQTLLDKAESGSSDESKLNSKFKKLTKELTNVNNELQEVDVNSQKGLGGLADDADKATKATVNVKVQLRELQDRMAAIGDVGSPEFQKLATEAGVLRDKMNNARAAINSMSDDFPRLTLGVQSMQAIGGAAQVAVGGFDALGLGSDNLVKSMQRLMAIQSALNGLQTLSKSLSDESALGLALRKARVDGLAKSVGGLGAKFAAVGKALLTNPIFLIGAAITAVVTVIGMLMNKLGLLKPILDTIGEVFGAIADAIQWVVDKIKEFLDWIGLTNFAAEEMAAKQQDAMQKIIDRSNELAESIGDRYDHEIRLAKIAGKDTTEQEIEKQKAIIKTAEVRQKAIDQLIEQNKITNKLTEEEIEKLKELRSETEKTIRESNQEIEALNAQRTQDQKNALEKERQDAKASYEKMLADRKKFEQDRLAAIRQIRDLELEMMDEGINKDLAINQEKYARLIADTLANENLLQEEKDRIVSLLKEQEFEKNKEIELGYAQALSDALKDADKQRAEAAEEERKAKEEREAEYNQMLLESQRVQLEKQQAQEEAYREARVSLAENTISALQGIEQLLAATGAETAGLQKTIALVQIATDTAKAISAVVAGATAAAAAGGPAAPFLIAGYIASGIATVTSAIASAYSALQAAPPLGGSVGGGGVGGALSQAANSSQSPSVQLFGQNNDLNNLSAPQDVESTQQITVNAVVSETEVTNKQNTIKKITESAAL